MNNSQQMVVFDVESSMKMITIADKLFQSGLFKNVENAAGAFAIIQYGIELGIPPMQALQNINLIHGKPVCNSQLLQALARRAGVTWKIIKSDTEICSAEFKRGEEIAVVSFSLEEARKAGLIKQGGGWEKYPADLLFARCMTRGIRRIAPDIILGMYTVDELSEGKYQNISEIPQANVYETTAEPVQEVEPQIVDTELELRTILLTIVDPWYDEVNALLQEQGISQFQNSRHYRNSIIKYFEAKEIPLTDSVINGVKQRKASFLNQFIKWRQLTDKEREETKESELANVD